MSGAHRGDVDPGQERFDHLIAPGCGIHTVDANAVPAKLESGHLRESSDREFTGAVGRRSARGMMCVDGSDIDDGPAARFPKWRDRGPNAEKGA